MAFRSIFKNTFNAAVDTATAPVRISKNRRKKRKYDQVTEDIKVLREVRQNARKNNSKPVFDRSAKALQNPNSFARRKMRVENFKRSRKKKKKNERGSVMRRIFGN